LAVELFLTAKNAENRNDFFIILLISLNPCAFFLALLGGLGGLLALTAKNAKKR